MAKSTPVYNEVAGLLRQNFLMKALDVIKDFGKLQPSFHGLTEKALDLQFDYGRMLDYYTSGSRDPQQSQLHDSLANRAWQLAELIFDAETGYHSPATPHTAALLASLHQEPLSDTALNAAFMQVADSRHLDDEDRKALNQAILADTLPEFVRATLLGAVTLHLTQSFNARMVEDLYAYTLDDQPIQIQMQAWVTLVLVALTHEHRIKHLPRLREQYKLLCEDNAEQLLQIQIALFQCLDAILVSDKLFRNTGDDGVTDLPNDESVRQFFNNINEGVDMSYNLFLKMRTIAFFSAPGTLHHWLEPFSTEQPQVRAILDSHPEALPWTRMLMQSVAQSETDKYGSFLSMQAVDHNLMSTISQKMHEVGLDVVDVQPLSPLWVMRNYLHDLFRYFSMSPRARSMQRQPFQGNLHFRYNLWLKAVVNTPQQQKSVAEYLFRKERWAEAERAYQNLLDQDSMQKRAYAALQPNTLSGDDIANRVLTRCNILYPDNKWTLRHLADAKHRLGLFDEELIILQQALQQVPNDKDFLWRQGRCLICLGQYTQALEPLFRAEVLNEGSRRVAHEIAHVSMLMDNRAQAEQYIARILSATNASPTDWCLGGHIALQAGNKPLAYQRYQKALTGNPQFELFPTADDEELRQAGITVPDVALMRDALHRWSSQSGHELTSSSLK